MEDFPIDQSKHFLFGASKVAGDVLVQEYVRDFRSLHWKQWHAAFRLLSPTCREAPTSWGAKMRVPAWLCPWAIPPLSRAR